MGIRTAFAASALLACAAASAPALAGETVEIGVIKNSDLSVVQKLLYPKTGETEVAILAGWMPFDPLVTTPNLQIGINQHLSESASISVQVGGGYGLKTARYTELEGPAYGVAPYAFRYLASALVGAEWAPIYAKMRLGPKTIVHHDVYGAARLGASLEQSVIPGGGLTVAPTVQLGIGARFFAKPGLAVRFEVNDALIVENRKLTDDWHFKQNAGVQLGVSVFPGVGKEGR